MDGNLYLSWTGTDRFGRLNVSISRDNGLTWPNFYPEKLVSQQEYSGQGPALGIFNEGLVIAWTDSGTPGGGDRINVARVDLKSDGDKAGAPLRLSNKAPAPLPALVQLNDRLMIAAIGRYADTGGTQVFYTLSSDAGNVDSHFDEALPRLSAYDWPALRQSDRQHAPSLLAVYNPLGLYLDGQRKMETN